MREVGGFQREVGEFREKEEDLELKREKWMSEMKMERGKEREGGVQGRERG